MLKLRNAIEADFRAIQAIYADEVLHGLATFEEIPPSIHEMTQRWRSVVELGLPYRVAMVDQRVVGFAYASLYRFRPAYRFTVENSLYVSPDFRGQGVGRALLGSVIDGCKDARQMIAVISDSNNPASIALHQSMGFTQAGRLENVGFKHNQWIDTLLMQRAIHP